MYKNGSLFINKYNIPYSSILMHVMDESIHRHNLLIHRGVHIFGIVYHNLFLKSIYLFFIIWVRAMAMGPLLYLLILQPILSLFCTCPITAHIYYLLKFSWQTQFLQSSFHLWLSYLTVIDFSKLLHLLAVPSPFSATLAKRVVIHHAGLTLCSTLV